VNVRLLRAPASGPEAGWTYVIQAVIAIGIAYISARLAAKKRGPIADDKPTTLTTPGSYLPWFIGIRKVGPVFLWAGDRVKHKEKPEGGKGLTPKQDVWYESGWHGLGVGPVDALLEISQAGSKIFEGRITRDSHPSGSTIDLGKEGSFVIYWGEQNQPIDTYLNSQIAVGSRWPRAMYVIWNRKRLGTTAVWPLLTYVLERRPSGAFISGPLSWYEPTATLSGQTADVDDFVANANPDVGYLEVDGDITEEITHGLIIRVTGNGLADDDYVVRRSEAVQVQVSTSTDEFGEMHPVYEIRTRVFLESGTAGANANGQIEIYEFAKDDGANIAHAVADLLFLEWPGGLGLDPNNPEEPWDMESLTEWGEEAEALGLRSSIIAVDGAEVSSVLGTILQDHGVMLVNDALNGGRLKFQRIREPVPPLVNISSDIFSGDAPERETLLGEKERSKLTFTFTDREKDFGDNTLMIRDDGAVYSGEFFRADDFPITSTVHFRTASILAEQRSQEQLGGGNKFVIKMSRGGRELLPGQAITADTFDDVLRVLEVGVDPLSEEVSVQVTADVYGVRRTDYIDPQGGVQAPPLDPAEDVFRSIEVPEHLLSAEEMRLMVARIRAHAQVFDATIHISRDDSTYTVLGGEPGTATGGLLDVALSASAAYYEAQGPTFQLVGPDAAGALDLTGDDVSWSKGRQVALFADSDNNFEICFVRKITALGGDQWRLDGLLRARYDTRRRAWGVGAEVYVFADDTFQTFTDILLEPLEDLFVKSQPLAVGGAVPLTAIAPIGRTQRGKGLVPVVPEALHTTAPHVGTNSYSTGDDVDVRWGWSTSSSKNTGAGYQPAGVAIGAPVIKGSFLVELRTTGGTLVQTDTVDVPEISYPNATLAAAPISEGSFKVRVYHVNNGFVSTMAELTVTKV
jgi:hypothetical protein